MNNEHKIKNLFKSKWITQVDKIRIKEKYTRSIGKI